MLAEQLLDGLDLPDQPLRWATSHPADRFGGVAQPLGRLAHLMQVLVPLGTRGQRVGAAQRNPVDPV